MALAQWARIVALLCYSDNRFRDYRSGVSMSTRAVNQVRKLRGRRKVRQRRERVHEAGGGFHRRLRFLGGRCLARVGCIIGDRLQVESSRQKVAQRRINTRVVGGQLEEGVLDAVMGPHRSRAWKATFRRVGRDATVWCVAELAAVQSNSA